MMTVHRLNHNARLRPSQSVVLGHKRLSLESSMLDAAKYEAVSTLRNGRRIKVRALRPDDRAKLIAAVDRSSPEFSVSSFLLS